MVAVAQLVRAPDCGSGGRGFDTHQSPKSSIPSWLNWIEHWISAPVVTGSNPVEGANLIQEVLMKRIFLLLLISNILAVDAIDTIWVDTTISKIEWTGYKITGSHNGQMKIKNGYILKNKDLII